jgi:hypothetical protein
MNALFAAVSILAAVSSVVAVILYAVGSLDS